MESGSQTLKDAVNEALRDWVTNVRTTYYLLGSAMGPHPYPMMVRDFHRVIGDEARAQAAQAHRPAARPARRLRRRRLQRHRPLLAVHRATGACASSASSRAATASRRGKHGASLGAGAVGVLHGSMSYLLQNDDGQIAEAHSISAGLDYPGVGPEHAYYKDSGRFEYVSVTDDEALEALPGAHAARGHHAGARVRPRGRPRRCAPPRG